MKFFGELLMALGILIATLSGLCSAVILTGPDGPEISKAAILPLIAIIGGLPFLSGVGMFFWGRWLLRLARERGE